jgi:hypothetical protein
MCFAVVELSGVGGRPAWRHLGLAARQRAWHFSYAGDRAGFEEDAASCFALAASAILARRLHRRLLRRRRRHRLYLGNRPVPCVRARRHTVVKSVKSVHQQVRLSRYVLCTHVLKAADSLVDVAGREFIKLLVVAKDDDGNVDGA